jgi:hypothetical protein
MKIASFFQILFLCGIMVWWVPSCTDTLSGGTGTETINTYAVLPNGSPASGATVQLIDARWWIDSIHIEASPVLGKGVTDKNGFCSITIPKRRGQINLQIDHCSEGLLLQIPTKASSDIDTVKLKSYSSISGSSANNNVSSSSALIAGTTYKVAIDENNLFSFKKVPPGSFALLCMKSSAVETRVLSNTSFSITAGAEDTLDTCITDQQRLLIDNFESGVGPTSLGAIIPVLGWYVLSDSQYFRWDPEDASWKQNAVNTIIAHSTIGFDSIVNSDGHAFFYTTKLDSNPLAVKANSLIGISFKPLSSNGIDLSSMTHFSFKASGNGTIWVRFETEALDKIYSGVSHYSYPIVLSKNPKIYSIPVDSLRILPEIVMSEYYPWKALSQHVFRIEFNFSPQANVRNEKLTLSLDDLYLDGVSLSSVYAKFQQ